MEDTAAIRQKILNLWRDFENEKLTTQEARTHIGFARTILDTLKVEIAASHLATVQIPAVPMINGKNNKKHIGLHRQ